MFRLISVAVVILIVGGIMMADLDSVPLMGNNAESSSDNVAITAFGVLVCGLIGLARILTRSSDYLGIDTTCTFTERRRKLPHEEYGEQLARQAEQNSARTTPGLHPETIEI